MRKTISTVCTISMIVFYMELLVCIFVDIPKRYMVISLVIWLLCLITDNILNILDGERRYNLRLIKRLRNLRL
ncbi:hypothetical protein DW790_05730 [Firmicutes bacterium AM31-12AC]|nr:hypothetical protein DW790_05730 [Firmicutes bacterium AM31-12AC]